MPNWTSNSITIEGTAEALQEIYDAKFDFQKLHPSPFIHGENYDEGWYDWCNKYWGTKWSPNEVDIDYTAGETSLTASFETAWCTPYALLTYLTILHPSLVIINEWQDEGYESVGITHYAHGSMIGQTINPIEYTNKALEQFSEINTWFCYDDYTNFIETFQDSDNEEDGDDGKKDQVTIQHADLSYEDLIDE